LVDLKPGVEAPDGGQLREMLSKNPRNVMATMTDTMKDDVHRLAPRVAVWLKQIGAMEL
jgi:hypothetical protein